jgi:hypothetical protein
MIQHYKPADGEIPMGDGINRGLKVSFDSSMQLEFRGAKITSIAGIFAYRELDEMFGLTAMGDDLFFDFRTGRNTRHAINGLLRQGIYSRLAGLMQSACAATIRPSRHST